MAALRSNPEEAKSSTIQPASNPNQAALDHIRLQLHTRTLAVPLYAFLLSDVAITHASRGLVVARLTLGPQHVNSAGCLHGGVSATLVDWAGGMAIAAHDLRATTGASVDIHVQYLGPAAAGELVEIEGRADYVGGSLAYTSVAIHRVTDGVRAAPLVLGRHTKYVRGTAPAPAPTDSAEGQNR